MKPLTLRKISILILAAAMITGPGVTALAVYHGEGEWGDKDPGEREAKMKEKMNKMFEEIGLSEEQLQQIEAMRRNKTDETKGLHTELREKREALRQILDATETDRAAVDNLVNEIADLQTQKVRDRADHILALKEILTPEQFTQLRAKKETMWKGKKGEWGKHKHHKTEV